MNTPAHIVLGATVFSQYGKRGVTTAAILGGLMPDLALFVLVFWSLVIQNIPPETVFGTLYYSESWQRIFAIDNSAILWGAGFVAGLALRRPILTAFTGSALLHVALDFPLHHDDGHPHFWPFSRWVFESPLSYWDEAHYAGIIGPLEIALVVICAIILWRRHGSWLAYTLIGIGILAEIAPKIIFGFMF